MPPNLEDLHVLRIVVRNGFSRDLGDLLLADLRHAMTEVERQPAPLSDPVPGFHH
jgi:glutamate decarboxylase